MTSHSKPSIIAHRGAKSEAPENTLSAFEAALKYSIAGIELDVQLSKDNIPVVFHDQSLWRFTRKIKSMSKFTYAELARMDLGSWFHRKFKGEVMPTLDSILENVANRTRLFIEIKTRRRAKKENALLTEEVIHSIERCQNLYHLKPLYILSFDRESLLEVHRRHPHWHCVLNIESPHKFRLKDFHSFSFLWGICCNVNTLTKGFSERVKENNIMLLSYTSNKPRQVTKALKMGVDMMMTDNPGWIFQTYKNEFKPKF